MEKFHPLILLMIYIGLLSTTIFYLHPMILIMSCFASLIFYGFIQSWHQLFREVRFYMFFFILIAITNPLFVHRGETPLFFLNDQAITLEALIYGVVIAGMLLAVIFWSKAFSKLITSDKIVFLFGNIVPKFSLVLSITLKFVPMLKRQIKETHQAQKTIGLYTSKSLFDRLARGFNVLNAVISWGIEHAVEQGMAMKSKGYGLKGRTHFALYQWQKTDWFMLFIYVLLFIMIGYFTFMDNYDFTFYPVLSSITFSSLSLVSYNVMAILLCFPILIEIKELIQWRFAQSKI